MFHWGEGFSKQDCLVQHIANFVQGNRIAEHHAVDAQRRQAVEGLLRPNGAPDLPPTTQQIPCKPFASVAQAEDEHHTRRQVQCQLRLLHWRRRAWRVESISSSTEGMLCDQQLTLDFPLSRIVCNLRMNEQNSWT